MVIWIIGMSSAGKTQVGRRLYDRLKAERSGTVFFDGDLLREAVGEDLGYTREDRQISEVRTSRLCKLMADQSIDVVCAKLSNAPGVRRWNRENIPGYFEVYLKVDEEVLRQRDLKGLYAAFEAGEATDVVGMDIPFLPPEDPWLTIENNGDEDIDSIVDKIYSRVSKERP